MRIIERCTLSTDTLDEALALVESTVGSPRFAAAVLRGIVMEGAVGEVTVDVSNVVAITLYDDAKRAGLPSERWIRPLWAWCQLVGGGLQRDNGALVLALEGFAFRDDAVVEGAPNEALSALSQWGYQLPFELAVAVSLCAPREGTSVSVRRFEGRRGAIDVLELHLLGAGEGVSDALARLSQSAGNRAAFSHAWRDNEGAHYVEGFGEGQPSGNYRAP